MPLSPKEFREALSHFASGVTVVTTRNAAGQSAGLTASAFTSVSLECRLIHTYNGGDHTICVGEVETARVLSGEPLLYYRHRSL
jgi:flavin reductase (DIM6/NTAB) family NADH-FMN oxidoreductase RutF